jgi:hypothetical protein
MQSPEQLAPMNEITTIEATTQETTIAAKAKERCQVEKKETGEYIERLPKGRRALPKCCFGEG